MPSATLSPSRAAEFVSCPLLYRFRNLDRLPEPVSPAAARGTLVHRVLERLYDLPAEERLPDRARELLAPEWDELIREQPELAGLAPGPESPTLLGWLASCGEVLQRYFDLEDPRRLQPRGRELPVEAVLGSGLLVRGVIDRLDEAPDGRLRVVDYKTGRAPAEGAEAAALFQLRFYALALWRSRGRVPAMLQLVYLGSGEVIRYVPDEADLLATERKVEAIWQAIRAAEESRDWRPHRSRACGWCAHRGLCPEWGGTPPPAPPTPPAPPAPPAPPTAG